MTENKTSETDRLKKAIDEHKRVHDETNRLLADAVREAEKSAHSFAPPIKDDPKWRGPHR